MFFLVGLLIIGASFALSPTAEAVSWRGEPLPPLCLFKRMWGIECFGCGLTRAFVFTAHGHLSEAFSMHKLGPLLWATLAFQIPWRGYWLVRRRPGTAAPPAREPPAPLS